MISSTTDQEAIAELLDREAIRSVLYRYCRGMDRRDGPLLASVYWDDAYESHGDKHTGPIAGFLSRKPSAFDLIRHSLGTINIDLDGDLAYSEAYFVASCVFRDPDGQRMLRVHEGRYIDKLERRGNEWRILRRTVVKDFIDVRPLNEPGEEYPQSTYYPDDLVYQRD
jgi:hypothetical protein